MKKSTALMVLAGATGLVSCGGPSTPKANLQNDIDSLSYSIGVTNTQGLMDYAMSGLKIDSVDTDKFVKGILEGIGCNDKKEIANVAGLLTGDQVSNQMFEGIKSQIFRIDSTTVVDKDKFLTGFIESVKGKCSVTSDSAFTYLRTTTNALQNDSVKTVVSIDTLSYMLGVSNSNGLIGYATNQMGVDSAYISIFTNGLEQGTKTIAKTEKAKLHGFQIGTRVCDNVFETINSQMFGANSSYALNKDNFIAGFVDGLQKKNIITMDNATSYIRLKAEELQTKALEAKYGEYKKENEKFLEDNKSKEGIQTTESGLQYKVVKEGKGEKPAKDSKVKVHYKGTLIDGTQFDSSYDRKEPAVFPCNQVIPGWTEALTMMPVGSKWELYIPQELGYGSRDMGTIKPFSTLIFEVELLSIEK